jgi:beta-phosphoglucomutase-like phosphatase (HAD superfamily)
MGFEGLIFDLNGVLWWDSHLQEEAWVQCSRRLRGWPLSTEEMAWHVHGRDNRHTLEYLSGRPVGESELARLAEEKEVLYRQLCLDAGADFRLSPGAPELLDFLVDHRIGRTIATSTGKVNLDFFLQHLCLDRWFDVDRIAYSDGTRPGKPAPDIYLQAAGNLGLEPAHCVVVEDSQAGIQAAQAAGVGHIIALGPACRHGRLARFEGVDQVVESLEQVAREQLFL